MERGWLWDLSFINPKFLRIFDFVREKNSVHSSLSATAGSHLRNCPCAYLIVWSTKLCSGAPQVSWWTMMVESRESRRVCQLVAKVKITKSWPSQKRNASMASWPCKKSLWRIRDFGHYQSLLAKTYCVGFLLWLRVCVDCIERQLSPKKNRVGGPGAKGGWGPKPDLSQVEGGHQAMHCIFTVHLFTSSTIVPSGQAQTNDTPPWWNNQNGLTSISTPPKTLGVRSMSKLLEIQLCYSCFTAGRL